MRANADLEEAVMTCSSIVAIETDMTSRELSVKSLKEDITWISPVYRQDALWKIDRWIGSFDDYYELLPGWSRLKQNGLEQESDCNFYMLTLRNYILKSQGKEYNSDYTWKVQVPWISALRLAQDQAQKVIDIEVPAVWAWNAKTGGTCVISYGEKLLLDLKKKTTKVIDALEVIRVEYTYLEAQAWHQDRLRARARRSEEHMPAPRFKFSRLSD